MIKEFVPYELALKLKNLGFDEPCFGKYDGKGKNMGKIWYEMPNQGQETIPVGDVLAPTLSQALRFFREKGYDVSFRKFDYGDESVFTGYYYTIYRGNETIDLHGADKKSKTYEGCELACLDKLVEFVEEKGILC